VLAPPSLKLPREPDVYLPIATPGVHRAGHLFRTDKVVALPLRALQSSPLPSVVEITEAIWRVLA
jgi:formylmethanofuran dehydrogenase subunit B